MDGPLEVGPAAVQPARPRHDDRHERDRRATRGANGPAGDARARRRDVHHEGPGTNRRPLRLTRRWMFRHAQARPAGAACDGAADHGARSTSTGDVIVPLDEDEVRDAVGELVAAGARALTISFLWSTINPAHEQRAREIAAEVAPDLLHLVQLGAQRRSRRVRADHDAVMNSYIGPLMARLRRSASRRAPASGASPAPCCSRSALAARSRARRPAAPPVRTVHSGPVAGTIAIGDASPRGGARDNVIAVDMGGTTFDVSVIHDGGPCSATSRSSSATRWRCRCSTSSRSARAAGASPGSTTPAAERRAAQRRRAARAGVLRLRGDRRDGDRRRRGPRSRRSRTTSWAGA